MKFKNEHDFVSRIVFVLILFEKIEIWKKFEKKLKSIPQVQIEISNCLKYKVQGLKIFSERK